MRILYFGLPLGLEVLRRHGHVPVAACLGHLGANGARRARTRFADGHRLLLGRPDLDDAAVLRALESVRADLVLSWFWPNKLPRAVLSLAPAFGVHPSLLPRWRGPDPFFWAIASGDLETGVSLHRLEAEYDTGAIVATRRVPIAADEDGWSLAKKLDRPSLSLLVECANRFAAGERLDGVAQDAALATAAPEPTEEDLALDFDRDALELERLVRAARPEPGARAVLGEALVTFLDVAVDDARAPGGLENGEAWVEGGVVRIRCGRGALRVSTVRDEDDDERIKSGRDLLRLLA